VVQKRGACELRREPEMAGHAGRIVGERVAVPVDDRAVGSEEPAVVPGEAGAVCDAGGAGVGVAEGLVESLPPRDWRRRELQRLPDELAAVEAAKVDPVARRRSDQPVVELARPDDDVTGAGLRAWKGRVGEPARTVVQPYAEWVGDTGEV